MRKRRNSIAFFLYFDLCSPIRRINLHANIVRWITK